jgi:hypothetical protein
MSEIAINTPFEAGEIIDIACAEFRKRLLGLSPLQGSKEYAAFSIEFNHKVSLKRAGEQDHEQRHTLAWGSVGKGAFTEVPDLQIVRQEEFVSQDPNEERLERDMPLSVETGDGRGGKIRKKVRVKV